MVSGSLLKEAASLMAPQIPPLGSRLPFSCLPSPTSMLLDTPVAFSRESQILMKRN